MNKEKPDAFWAWCAWALGTLVLIWAVALTRTMLLDGGAMKEKIIFTGLLYAVGPLCLKMGHNLVTAHLHWLYREYVLSSTGRTLMFLEIKSYLKKVAWTATLTVIGWSTYQVFFDWTLSVDIAMFASSPAFLSILLVWLRRWS